MLVLPRNNGACNTALFTLCSLRDPTSGAAATGVIGVALNADGGVSDSGLLGRGCAGGGDVGIGPAADDGAGGGGGADTGAAGCGGAVSRSGGGAVDASAAFAPDNKQQIDHVSQEYPV